MTKLRLDHETWRYKGEGKSVHYLDGPRDNVAACGVAELSANFWKGAGTQDEYEMAEQLPECRNCLRKLGRL